MQKAITEPERQPRLLTLSYVTLASVFASMLLAVASQFYSANHGYAEIAKLRSDIVEMKRTMADRSDLQAVRRSLLQLEKDVKNVSDNMPQAR